MQRKIIEVILHARRSLAVDEIAVQLAVRHSIDQDMTLDEIRNELTVMQSRRLVAQLNDGTYGVTAIARKLMGRTPCKRNGG